MKHQKHIQWSATAAIAAALALSATPLAAQSTDAPVADAPAVPIPPAEPALAAPANPAPASAPAIVVPDVSTAPAASGAAAAEPEPAPVTAATTTTTVKTARSAAPAARSTTGTTRSTTTRAAATPAAAAPVTAMPAPANDVAPSPDESVAPVATAPTRAPQPTPTQTNDVVGTLGVILLALLALAILAAGLLFLRRRHPVAGEVEETPVVTDSAKEPSPVYAAEPMAEPIAPVAAPTPLRRRDANPFAGALPSDGAAVDLPAKVPDSYEERSALLKRMVEARPDRANPFTDRKARLRRARLILQSLGTTFEREPLIDLSQYPNNWPELQRPRYEAA